MKINQIHHYPKLSCFKDFSKFKHFSFKNAQSSDNWWIFNKT